MFCDEATLHVALSVRAWLVVLLSVTKPLALALLFGARTSMTVPPEVLVATVSLACAFIFPVVLGLPV